MQNNKANQIPNRLIQKRRMNFNILAAFIYSHPQKGLRSPAVSLLIEKIPPSAYYLPYKHRKTAKVKHRPDLNFLNLAVNNNRYNSTYNSAVNGQSSVPYAENAGKISPVQVVIKYNIIGARADNSKYCSND